MAKEKQPKVPKPPKAPKAPKPPPGPYGVMAEFADDKQLLAATERAEGYRKMDAYSPFPVEGMDEALHIRTSRLPFLVLIGGLIGAALGFGMQAYATVYDYQFNIGGRPLFSWPMYMPITFELTILLAGLTCVFGMLGLNGFPLLYHPVFNVPRFRQVTRDGFFLCIEAGDPKFNLDTTRQFLQTLEPASVAVVEA